MKSIYIYTIILLYGCRNAASNEYIILTSGFSIDPATPRIGIKIQSDSIYYCEEKEEKKGEYNYFSNEFSDTLFLKFKNKIMKEFNSADHLNEEVIDGRPWQLIYSLENKRDTILYYYSNLTEGQAEISQEIEELSNRKFHQIKYYPFPEELLKYKLPPPPSLESLGIESHN